MVEFSNATLLSLGAVRPVLTVLVGNNPRYLASAVTAARASKAPYSYLDDKSRRQIPYVNTDGFEGIFESAMDEYGNGAGTINPALAIQRMLEKAEHNGVVVRFGAAVSSVRERSQEKGLVTLECGETLVADKVISAAGVWNDRFLGNASSASLHTKSKVLKSVLVQSGKRNQVGRLSQSDLQDQRGTRIRRHSPQFRNETCELRFFGAGHRRGVLHDAGKTCRTGCI